MSWPRRIIGGVLLAAFFLPILRYAIPAHRDLVRLAMQLAPLPMEERERALFGPWYAQAEEIRASVPQHASIDFVLLRPEARDLAVLAGALMYPRDARYFDGWDAWRARRRAEFMNDSRAVNAAPGPPPPPAPFVVVADPAATPQLRLVEVR